jgi:hypothetical protein
VIRNLGTHEIDTIFRIPDHRVDGQTHKILACYVKGFFASNVGAHDHERSITKFSK